MSQVQFSDAGELLEALKGKKAAQSLINHLTGFSFIHRIPQLMEQSCATLLSQEQLAANYQMNKRSCKLRWRNAIIGVNQANDFYWCDVISNGCSWNLKFKTIQCHRRFQGMPSRKVQKVQIAHKIWIWILVLGNGDFQEIPLIGSRQQVKNVHGADVQKERFTLKLSNIVGDH